MISGLSEMNKQVIISCTEPPEQINIQNDCFSRVFEMGGVFEIGKPDFDDRLLILEKRADEKNIEISNEILELIAKTKFMIYAALLSPTSRNFCSWEFIVVDDKVTIGELSKAKASGSAFLKDAPLAFVVLGDPQISDVWVEDASIASIIIQLAAQSLGLGSCWIQIRKRNHDDKTTSEDYVKDLLGIPEGKKVESIISIGYPNEDRPTHKIEDLRFDKVCELPSR